MSLSLRLPQPTLAGFTVTAERSRLVQFIFPSYYSSGAAVFAPGGAIEGVSSWHDLSGKTLSAVEGNYVVDAAPETPALQNVTFVLAATIEGGENGLHPAGMLTVQFRQALNRCAPVPPALQKRLLSSLPARLMDTSSERCMLLSTVLSSLFCGCQCFLPLAQPACAWQQMPAQHAHSTTASVPFSFPLQRLIEPLLSTQLDHRLKAAAHLASTYFYCRQTGK